MITFTLVLLSGEMITFTLVLLSGVQEVEKVCSKFTCQFAYSGKKFTLGLQVVCRKPKKKFALSSPVGLHTVAKSLHLVCTWFAIGLQEAEKFTCQFAYSGKSLH